MTINVNRYVLSLTLNVYTGSRKKKLKESAEITDARIP
jgi:hypothetical protein